VSNVKRNKTRKQVSKNKSIVIINNIYGNTWYGIFTKKKTFE